MKNLIVAILVGFSVFHLVGAMSTLTVGSLDVLMIAGFTLFIAWVLNGS